MNRRDRRAWASARSLADLGDRVAGWLNGSIRETPTHLGPPDPETHPHIPLLTRVNRAGFVTDNSQSADGHWTAWVNGFVSDEALRRLRSVLSPPLRVEHQCRGREHHGHGRPAWLRCPRRGADDLGSRSRDAARAVRSAWYVGVADPEPGRSDRLWPALARFADNTPAGERTEPSRSRRRSR